MKKAWKIITIILLICGVVFLIGTISRMDYLAEQGKEFPELLRNVAISFGMFMPFAVTAVIERMRIYEDVR